MKKNPQLRMNMPEACNEFLGALCEDVPVEKAATALLRHIESYGRHSYEENQHTEGGNKTLQLRASIRELLATPEHVDRTTPYYLQEVLWVIMFVQTVRNHHALKTGPNSAERAIKRRLEREAEHRRKTEPTIQKQKRVHVA
jgi:hypothetical protein